MVAPCYNEAEVIRQFYLELKRVLAQGSRGFEHCIVFVDDGSEDATLEKLNELAAADSCVRVLSLSRNFGHQVALTAGSEDAEGDAVILMDSDLQHPPALISRMLQLWREGFDIVSAVRESTSGTSRVKRWSSSGFYALMNKLSGIYIVPGAADFCVLSERAHAALRSCPERHRFLRGMVSWIGFRRICVPFTAPPRAAGRSKYSVRKMCTLGLSAVFSFSTTPIRVATGLGLMAILVSLIYLCYIGFCLLSGRALTKGWTSLMFLVTFLGGVQLVSTGVLESILAGSSRK